MQQDIKRLRDRGSKRERDHPDLFNNKHEELAEKDTKMTMELRTMNMNMKLELKWHLLRLLV